MYVCAEIAQRCPKIFKVFRIWQMEDLSSAFTSAPSHGLGGRSVVLNMRRHETPQQTRTLQYVYYNYSIYCSLYYIILCYIILYFIYIYIAILNYDEFFIADVFEIFDVSQQSIAKHTCHQSSPMLTVTKASNHRRSASRCGTRRRLDHFFPPFDRSQPPSAPTFSY